MGWDWNDLQIEENNEELEEEEDAAGGDSEEEEQGEEEAVSDSAAVAAECLEGAGDAVDEERRSAGSLRSAVAAAVGDFGETEQTVPEAQVEEDWDDGAVDEYGFRIVTDPGLDAAAGLREIVLPFDRSGQNRYLELCEGLGVTPRNQVHQSLMKDAINLKYFGVSPRMIRALTQALAYNETVHTLDLTGNILNPSAGYYLGEMLRENMTLRILRLSGCRLGPQGVALLHEGLEHNQSLEVLDLSNNKSGNEGIQALQEALRQNMSLKYLDFSHNDLGAPAAASLAKVMNANERIQALRLGRNNLYADTKKGLRLLLNSLKEKENFRTLDLEWNALSSSVAAPLRSFFAKSPSIQEVFLNNNRFSGPDINIIKRGISKSQTLEHLKIGFNPFEPVHALNLLRASPSTLKILDMDGIMVNKNFFPTPQGLSVIIEGILSNYQIIGPNLGEMMLKRARFEGFKPKRKKRRRDFGHVLLQLAADGVETILPQKLFDIIKTSKIKVREELVLELFNEFKAKKKRVDVAAMLATYMKLFPETELPPVVEKKPKPKKRTKKHKKQKK